MKQLRPPQSKEVLIELSDAVPTDAEIEADFKSLMNATEISADMAVRLRGVGLHIKRQGVLETTRGALFVTQACAVSMCRDLYRLAQAKMASKDVDAEGICKISEQLAKMVGKVADTSAVMLSQEPAASNVNGASPAPMASFPAGANVFGPGSVSHFHQTPPPPSEKTVANPTDGA